MTRTNDPLPYTHQQLLAKIVAKVRAVRDEARLLPLTEVAYMATAERDPITGYPEMIFISLCEPLPQRGRRPVTDLFDGTAEEFAERLMLEKGVEASKGWD